MIRRDSIRARLLLAAALWLTLALLGAWWVIGGVLDRFVTDRFDAEAQAIADTVIGGTEVTRAAASPCPARRPTRASPCRCRPGRGSWTPPTARRSRGRPRCWICG